ncbi:vWA domain-containing protein [Prosthecobacter sp.]|uniref:vWA domain-containing protein n=1 Tax=Prosthecobacter sp. TaxID=1965333 RepID=UPI002ABD0F59|nr:vWA domain-containing protein [Prosthecobacter sp.]MDZ4403846.1 vWA domain-containing protein [Prosthecobacter sp.]
MNWLFPLYLAGAAAIIAPILLHLRRRPPQDRVEFSSLLFLDAQTPVPVSKRRLENWLLLLLRCLALILLALMFSRPFVQSESTAAASPNSATLILLDRSASMRRADLWKQAIAEAEKQLKAAKLTDRIALAVFDRELTPLWSFEEDRNTPANRLTAIQTRLASLTPTWNATQLDRALIAAVPSFDSSTTSLKKRIHLISDLQEGTKLDALRTIAWPAELTLSIHRLDPATNDNLSIVLAAREQDGSADTLVRLRLSNTRDSALRDFTLVWQGAPKTDAITAQIPPGASRILTAPPNSTNATTLTLTGDTHDFDNRIFIAPPQPRTVRIHFLGKDATRNEAVAPLYYLARALQPTATLAPVLTADEKLPAQPADILFIVGSAPADGLRDYIERGGFLVTVPSDATLLKTLTGLDLTVTADTSDEYRMLAEVKTEHPLLKPFVDPKLRDFTKLRFWKHRHIEIKTANPSLETLATFDNSHPAILSARIGKGTLIVLASGWHPGDSQFALSTKFVPLLYGWLAAAGFSHDPAATLLVGDSLPLDATQAHTITDPENKTHSVKPGETFTTSQIGLHKVQSATRTQTIAVNLPPDESRVLPLEPQKLAEYGIKLSSTSDTAAASETTDQRLTATDTEQRQNLWWWFLVTLLAVLLLETAIAGRAKWSAQSPVRRSATSESTA